MNGHVVRAAWLQAVVTFRRKYLIPSALWFLLTPVFLLAVLWVIRDRAFLDVVPASGYLLAGMVGYSVVSIAVVSVASVLQSEREDGTLLRAKAIPHGIGGHLLAKLLLIPVEALIVVVPILVGAAILLPELLPTGPRAWLLLVVFYLLALAAMLPWGAILGSVFRSTLAVGLAILGLYALAIVSGFFFPISYLPGWVQGLVQLTPMYWIGMGMRSVFLPAEAAAVELHGTFQTTTALVVIAGWAVVGFLLAPSVLRRMANRQSGSVVAAARERVLSRGY